MTESTEKKNAHEPYLTEEFPPISGVMKASFEDFAVTEIPAYEPSGSGDHVYFEIEKRGVTTMQAISRIAGALEVRRRDMGCAGMKDSRGVTRQRLSLEHVDPSKVEALDLAGVKILWTKRHGNKLKTGHLKGNRFSLKLREVDPERIEDVRRVVEILAKKGVPNYFGKQRFGARGDTWQVGAALINGDFQAAASIICGSPGPLDEGAVLEARTLYEEGRLAESADLWPRGYGDSAKICRFLDRRPGDFKKAVMSRDRKLLSLYVSAFQSHLFNRVLAERIRALDTVMEGDLAWKHDKGVVFQVEDPEAENPRARAGEISPSGPMFGKRMKPPKGKAAELEERVLADYAVRLEDFPSSGPLQCAGGRRPLRFFPAEPEVGEGEDVDGPFVAIDFSLPSGCYATTVLREIFKDGLIQG